MTNLRHRRIKSITTTITHFISRLKGRERSLPKRPGRLTKPHRALSCTDGVRDRVEDPINVIGCGPKFATPDVYCVSYTAVHPGCYPM